MVTDSTSSDWKKLMQDTLQTLVRDGKKTYGTVKEIKNELSHKVEKDDVDDIVKGEVTEQIKNHFELCNAGRHTVDWDQVKKKCAIIMAVLTPIGGFILAYVQ